MPTRLIINADDLGFSPGVTDGILRCHREGVLTSTTLMTTMPDCDRAIDLAGQMPALGVGIHLCLTQGIPLTKCPRILNRDGTFTRSLPRLFWRLRSHAARHAARDEMIAQIQYAKSRGLTPTHVDSHKHVCHLPALHGALLEACETTGIHWIRTVREVTLPSGPRMTIAYRRLAAYGATLARRLADEGGGTVEGAGVKTTDWFFGLATTGRTCLPTYEALAAQPPEGLGELMVHPGYSGDLSVGTTRLVRERVVEMEALCDPRVRAVLERAGIRRVRHGEV